MFHGYSLSIYKHIQLNLIASSNCEIPMICHMCNIIILKYNFNYISWSDGVICIIGNIHVLLFKYEKNRLNYNYNNEFIIGTIGI